MTDNVVIDCEEAYRRYGTMLYRICLSHLRSSHDAEDALQEVFFKYMTKPLSFKNEEHKKAWLIKVAINHSKDVLRRKKRRGDSEYSDEIREEAEETEDFGVLEKIFALPDKYKDVFVLHYLENTAVSEISAALGISESAVKMRLMRGRELLKEVLKEEGVEV